MISLDPLVWISILWVFAGLSYLWGDNPLYRLAESCMIGVAIGNGLNTAILTFRTQIYVPMTTKADLLAIAGLLIGVLAYTLFLGRRFGWLTRYPTAIMYGQGAGITMTSMVGGSILAIVSYFNKMPLGIEWVIGVIIAVSILTYFVFSKEHTGAYGVLARIGQAFLYMATIGFGQIVFVYKGTPTVIERWYFILRDWLHIIA